MDEDQALEYALIFKTMILFTFFLNRFDSMLRNEIMKSILNGLIDGDATNIMNSNVTHSTINQDYIQQRTQYKNMILKYQIGIFVF